MERSASILLIEDNEDHQNLVKLLNKDFNFILDIGRNLGDFLNFTSRSKQSYTIILCDIDLDYKLEGLDILKAFQQSNLQGEIYAYTLSSIDKAFFIRKGFNGVINKNLDELRILFRKIKSSFKGPNFINQVPLVV